MNMPDFSICLPIFTKRRFFCHFIYFLNNMLCYSIYAFLQ